MADPVALHQKAPKTTHLCRGRWGGGWVAVLRCGSTDRGWSVFSANPTPRCIPQPAYRPHFQAVEQTLSRLLNQLIIRSGCIVAHQLCLVVGRWAATIRRRVAAMRCTAYGTVGTRSTNFAEWFLRIDYADNEAQSYFVGKRVCALLWCAIGVRRCLSQSVACHPPVNRSAFFKQTR